MAKKVLVKCPKCGTYNEAKIGFFQSKTVRCSCGYKIDVEAESMKTKVCSHCGNSVIYNATDYDAKCPVCGELINKKEDLMSNVDINCPSCNCKITVNKNDEVATCPLCGVKIEVQPYLKKIEAQKSGNASVIRCDFDNSTFVMKHPIEDFNLGSQLIVHESQEAVLFKDGKALDVFGSGRYTLSESNMPLIDELYKLADNKNQTIHSEVYFINKTTQMNIKWGTDSKVRLLDPESNIYIELGACGTFNIKVSDSRKLLIKLVGTEKSFGQDDIMGISGFGIDFIVGKFKSLIMNKVKANLARIITTSKISVVTVDQYIDLISERMKETINEILGEYGLFMPQFFITNIVLPDDDPNFVRLKQQYADKSLNLREEEIKLAMEKAKQERVVMEHETNAKVKAIDAQSEADNLKLKSFAEAEAYRAMAMAEADEMKAKGYTYSEETARQISQEALKDGGLGLAGDTISLGVALGTAGAVASVAKDTIKPIIDDIKGLGAMDEKIEPWTCPMCGKTDITSKFCPDCGVKMPENNTSWDCINCGKKGITSKFCPDCGCERK